MTASWHLRLLGLALLVGACAPAASPAAPAAPARPAATAAQAPAAPQAASQPAAQPAAQPPAQLAAPATSAVPKPQANAAEWARLKEAASREGRVVIAGPPFPNLRQAIIEGMEKTHGITVEYLGLPSGEATTRIEREAGAGRPTVDVHIGGSPTCWTTAERGLIDDVVKLIVDPALMDAQVWRDGSPRVLKPSPQMPQDFGCGIQGADWVMTDLFVNKDMVPPGTIKSWKDLLKPEYRGKIVSHDPRRPGSGGATVGYLYALFGEQYLQDLYVGQQVTYTVDYRQLAEWVARGAYPIGLSLVQVNVEPLRAAGLPLERVFPEDGPGSTLGGFSVVMRVKGSPNPNAGAVFLNWFLSREGQEMWEREMLETSLRTDVAHNVPEYVIPKPGVQYVNGYDPTFHFTERIPAEAKIVDLLPR
jgi:ABC-type Fe3+ transport system substrate-binding protein